MYCKFKFEQGRHQPQVVHDQTNCTQSSNVLDSLRYELHASGNQQLVTIQQHLQNNRTTRMPHCLAVAFATPVSTLPLRKRPSISNCPSKRIRHTIKNEYNSSPPSSSPSSSPSSPSPSSSTSTSASASASTSSSTSTPSSSSSSNGIEEDGVGSTLPTNSDNRSKLLLTRRIFSWTLRRRLAKVAQTQPPFKIFNNLTPSPPPSSQSSTTSTGLTEQSLIPHMPVPLETLLGQVIPSDSVSLESMLSPKEPVGTFIFHRGYSPIVKRRRSGDPPNRYLRLSYALVEPFSNFAFNCSNPRANGSIKSWYQTAAKWNVLKSDSKPSLVLKSSKRVYDDDSSGNLKLFKDSSSSSSSSKTTYTNGNNVISPLLNQSRWDRTLGRSPRIIAIGDVHGCIDELQQLLRLADYQPGDQVILCGDVLGKGPSSQSVVQLAREIGAKSVRGNHDHEVVRWWEARRRGDEDTIVSTEHARIAKSLSEEDHTWLLECPWFIECSEMDHLFVHAGFIPGVKLTQQNPRLMMNMRSILDDGSVTAKSVQNCEWARLWRGPQTVVFGHDAVRGLQEHEFAKGLDTGCVYGGRLTALLLPENRLISVAAKRAYIAPKRYRIE